MKPTERRIYQGIIVFLMLFLIAYVGVSNDKYNKQLEVNEQTYQALEKVRQQKDEMIADWEESYYQLMLDYEDLCHNYNVLREENESYITKSPNSVVTKDYNLTVEDIYLLASCVEAEAGTIGYATDLEQQYICQVILNRLVSDKFPNTMMEVIYQKVKGVPQFSVAYNGMLDKHKNVELKTLANVYHVLANGEVLPEYVQYFYSKRVKNNWVNTLDVYTREGRTVFAYYSMEDY